jgi:glycosyltransferase involved in cell wall biosynthesis
MARALPCIGTNVGGIPELLSDETMAPAGDISALASKLQQVLDSPEKMTRMSAQNLLRAQHYRPELLAKRRDEFYCFLRKATEKWNVEQQGDAEPALQERLSA